MLVSEIIDEIRDECNTNAVKVPNSYLLTGINMDYGETVMDILRVKSDFNFQGEESFTDLVSTTGLVAGENGYKGEFTFPSDLIRPIRVEISYDGTTYRPATFYDVADNKKSEHDNKDIEPGFFSESSPMVRFERDSFFVRPVNNGTTVTAGIHIWYEKRQEALTASDTPLFEANYHRILVLKGVLRVMKKFKKDYKISERNEVRGEINALNEKMLEFFKNRFKKQMQIRPAYTNMR